MRATCETDLAEKHSLKAVTEWMGHSYKVAEKHYLRVQEDEFDRAVKNGAIQSDDNESVFNHALQLPNINELPSAEKTVQKVVQHPPARGCTTKPRNAKTPCFTGSCNSVQHSATGIIGQVGFEPTTKGL